MKTTAILEAVKKHGDSTAADIAAILGDTLEVISAHMVNLRCKGELEIVRALPGRGKAYVYRYCSDPKPTAKRTLYIAKPAIVIRPKQRIKTGSGQVADRTYRRRLVHGDIRHG